MTKEVTSRVGRKPVAIPAGVEVKLQNDELHVKGPKGNLAVKIHSFVKVTIENQEINVKTNTNSDQIITGARKKLFRSVVGTTRANISNSVHGVSQGFETKLLLVGVGYRAQSQGKVLNLSLGFSHPTPFNIPEGVTIETPTQTEILVKGADKVTVGQVAAMIRDVRPPELYKGKGVRYANEVIELKETKKK
ncbi:MAG: 50S ribosomal protein L6 [Gammaproteobacteria bacterium]